MNQQDREYLTKKAKLIHQSDLLEDDILSVLTVSFVMGEAHQMREEIKKTKKRISAIRNKIHI